MVLVDTLFNFIVELVLNGGHLAIFLLMAIESSFIPFPSEAILPPAGYLVSIGELSFLAVMLSSTLGVLAGAWFSYFVGLYGGRPFIRRYGKYFFVKEDHIEKSEDYFKEHGEVTILTARLIPLIRQLVSLPAGWSRMDWKKFSLYTAIGGGIWNLILVGFGYLLGERWTLIYEYSTQLDILLIIAVALWIGYYWYSNGKN